MKKVRKNCVRLLSWLLAAVLLFAQPSGALAETTDGTNSEVAAENGLRKIPVEPEYDDETDTASWSYVWFGSYPQSEVTDKLLIEKLNRAAYNGYGDTVINGEKYRRLSKDQCTNSYYFGDAVYRYFKWEKLKWRVKYVNSKSNRLTLISDRGIDCQIFDRKTNQWADSSIRTWLNETFYNVAFDEEEKTAMLLDSPLVQEPNQIWLPGISGDDYKRQKPGKYRVQASDFAHIMGALINEEGNCSWWLRKPGGYSYNVNTVRNTGDINYITGESPFGGDKACVPEICLDLRSELWSLSEESLESGRWSWEEKTDVDETDDKETGMPENPVYDTKTRRTKWSYIYFGSYPQSEVTDEALLETLKSAEFDENGNTEIEGIKYRRLNGRDATHYRGDWTCYFKYEKLKWRVLKITGNRIYVMSDIGIDCQKYDEIDITDEDELAKTRKWEDSSIRTWLNTSFCNAAFSEEEQKDIISNPDKVSLPTEITVTEPQYGFPERDVQLPSNDNDRILGVSDFARIMGVSTYLHHYRGSDVCYGWWLRAVKAYSAYIGAPTVNGGGGVFSDKGDIYLDCIACAPVLYIDRESEQWSLADEEGNEEDNNGKEPDKEDTGNSGGNGDGGNYDDGEDDSGNDFGDKGRVLPENPVYDAKTDSTDWSYVYFGSYPQSEVKDPELLEILEKAEYDEDDNTEIGRNKYQRMYKEDKYRYFKWEKLKWRVMSVGDDKLDVISDKAIDIPPAVGLGYYKDIRDDDSKPHQWMKNVFCYSAFNAEEREALLMRGGGKVYVPTTDDVRDPAYGFGYSEKIVVNDQFLYSYEPSLSRRMMTTEFASVKGGGIEEPKYCSWLVQWKGFKPETKSDIASVHADGMIILNNYMSYFVPALYIDLNSDLWSMTDQEIDSGNSEDIEDNVTGGSGEIGDDTGDKDDTTNSNDSGNNGETDDSVNTGNDGNIGDSGNAGDNGVNTDDTGSSNDSGNNGDKDAIGSDSGNNGETDDSMNPGDDDGNIGDSGNGGDNGVNTDDTGSSNDSGNNGEIDNGWNTGNGTGNMGNSVNTGDDGSNMDDTVNAGGGEESDKMGDNSNSDKLDISDISDTSNTSDFSLSTPSDFTDRIVKIEGTVSKEEKKTVPVLMVSTAMKTITIGRGESFKADASVTPADATNQALTFGVSNQKIAVSEDGTVTGKKTGVSWLLIYSKGNTQAKAARIQVQVRKAPKKITLNAKQKSIKKGKAFKIKSKLPEGTASHKITFSSSKPSVARVSSSGKVLAIRKGSATITAKTFNGKKAKLKIRVH